MGELVQPASFADRIDALLSAIDTAVDGLADRVDIDAERAGNVLTLTFESGQRVVVNSQPGSEELWLAARSGGYHYRWDDASSTWVDARSDVDFSTRLAQVVEAETGVALVV